jgi:hypothetical protein
MHSGAEIFYKALRIAIWTSCCLLLIIFSYVLIQRPGSFSAAVYVAVHVDTFLATVGLFMCIVMAFIVDLWYSARFG